MAAVAACLMVGACAQLPAPAPAAEDDQRPAQPRARPQSAPQPRAVTVKLPPRKPPLPKQELTDQVMFKLMLAEIAAQRGQPQVAVSAYLDLARETRDPRVAQRATELAWNARFTSAALEAARIWLQADPESAHAHQIVATLLVSQAQLAEAQPHFAKWLAADPASVGQNFQQLSAVLGRHQDKAAVARLMQALAQPYAEIAEARFAVAQAAWGAGEQQLALAEVRAALKLRPDWELAALFQAQMLQRRSNAEALQYLAAYLKAHPEAKDVRLNYARLLISDRKYADARKQFEILLAAFPQNADVTMAVALLAIQAKDYDAAETQLRHALETGYQDADAVRIYLGQVSEERRRFDEALEWYGSVGQGGHYIDAQVRYAGVIAKQGRLADARRHLQQVSPQNNQQRVRLAQAEAQLLRDAGEHRQAFDFLGRMLEKLPDTPDLLYDHAMAAEKVNRLDVLEANLRQLIRLQPDHAHAYNALGYTLADRNERLPEARELIEKALALAPDDPFIMDSMGWVLYRLGRHREALDYLQRAFGLRPDPEIAAHLGEVLWADGQREQARKVWNGMLDEHPKNEVLLNAVKRFVQ
ncbi:MAG: tetratricopeptide repeat protein [Burkholderiales bacterium]